MLLLDRRSLGTTLLARALPVLVCLLLVAGCARPSSTSSAQGDRAAAQRAAEAETSRGQQAQAKPAPVSLLRGSELGAAYQFILERFVDRADHSNLIEAARLGLRETLEAAGVLPADTAPLDLLPTGSGNPERDWTTFASTYDAVVQRYPAWSLQARPDYAAIRHMLRSLNDGHSVFLTAEESQRREESNYSGIGVRLARIDPQGPPLIVEVFEGGPAQVAGVRSGDRILAIDDLPVGQLPLTEVSERIRGPQGREVALTLERTAAGAPFSVRVFRRAINTPLTEARIVEPGAANQPKLGYIRIWAFNELVPDRVGSALLEQRNAGVQGWVLDLRHNPGGDLQAVRRVAGYFLEQRPIGIMVNRAGERQALFGEPRTFTLRSPLRLVVLINAESGSGAEVLASAFKEYGQATLIGQRSAGNVGIANSVRLSDGSTVQVTVARLLAASGADLDRIGVDVDEPVELRPQDLEAGRDPQRDRAFEVLRRKLSS